VWCILCVSFRRDHCTYPFVLRGTDSTTVSTYRTISMVK
jgi:hypothetical protein